jgi:hypothetical protein
MPRARQNKGSKGGGARDRLKWETARDLKLDDDLAVNPGDELTSREAGKIGGNMVRKLIKAGEKSLAGKGPQPGKKP